MDLKNPGHPGRRRHGRGKSSGRPDTRNLHVEPIDVWRLAVREDYDPFESAVEFHKVAKNIEDSSGIFRGESPLDEVGIRLAVNDDVFVELVLLQCCDERAEFRRRKAAAFAIEFLGAGFGFGFCSHIISMLEVYPNTRIIRFLAEVSSVSVQSYFLLVSGQSSRRRPEDGYSTGGRSRRR